MEINFKKYENYDPLECCCFCRTRDKFGELSNMHNNFPVILNNINIKSSEHLYQALKFCKHPDIQTKILKAGNAFESKQIAYKFLDKIDDNFEANKIKIMRYVLKVKTACNFETIGKVLESTGDLPLGDLPIVEISYKQDDFWAAKEYLGNFQGYNVLGKLWMEIREIYNSKEKYELLKVPSCGLQLLGYPIQNIDNFKITDVVFKNILFADFDNYVEFNTEFLKEKINNRLNSKTLYGLLPFEGINHLYEEQIIFNIIAVKYIDNKCFGDIKLLESKYTKEFYDLYVHLCGVIKKFELVLIVDPTTFSVKDVIGVVVERD